MTPAIVETTFLAPDWRIQTKSLNLTNEWLNGVMRTPFSKTNYA
jgi:hypothetical protein